MAYHATCWSLCQQFKFPHLCRKTYTVRRYSWHLNFSLKGEKLLPVIFACIDPAILTRHGCYCSWTVLAFSSLKLCFSISKFSNRVMQVIKADCVFRKLKSMSGGLPYKQYVILNWTFCVGCCILFNVVKAFVFILQCSVKLGIITSDLQGRKCNSCTVRFKIMVKNYAENN